MRENTGSIYDTCSVLNRTSPSSVCSWGSHCLQAAPIHLHWFKFFIYSSQSSSVELSQGLQIGVLLLPPCSHHKLCGLRTPSTLPYSYLMCFISAATLRSSSRLTLLISVAFRPAQCLLHGVESLSSY